MNARVAASMLLLMCMAAGSARGQADDAYQARLKAGREAAYKKYMIQAPRPKVEKPVRKAAAPAGAGRAPVTILAHPSAQAIFAGHATPFAFGDRRYNFYHNLNLYRRQRWTDYPLAPYIYQPVWDWRYRRSWPRPVRTREYVKSHWLWDGVRYTFVPGHVEYQTQWVVRGWPRYHWRGSHYSVSISFNR